MDKRREESPNSPRSKTFLGWLGDQGPVWISAVGTLLAAVVAAIGLLIAGSSGGGSGNASHDSSQSSSQTPRPAKPDALYPATIPPRYGTCDKPLFVAVDGSVGPITCGRKVNVAAWRRYATTNPLVMSLGRDTDPERVGAAMCTDFHSTETNTSKERMTYRIAAAYYGWNFALDPSELFPDNC